MFVLKLPYYGALVLACCIMLVISHTLMLVGRGFSWVGLRVMALGIAASFLLAFMSRRLP